MPNTLRLPAHASRLTGLRRLALTGDQVEFDAGVALPRLEALALRARGAYRGVWAALPRFAGLRSFAFAAPASMDTEAGEAALQVCPQRASVGFDEGELANASMDTEAWRGGGAGLPFQG